MISKINEHKKLIFKLSSELEFSLTFISENFEEVNPINDKMRNILKNTYCFIQQDINSMLAVDFSEYEKFQNENLEKYSYIFFLILTFTLKNKFEIS